MALCGSWGYAIGFNWGLHGTLGGAQSKTALDGTLGAPFRP